MKKLGWFILCGILSLSWGSVVIGQSLTCPTIVETALASTEQHCNGLGRNSVCYASDHIDAVFHPTLLPVSFAVPSDIADLSVIEQIQTAALNLATQQWGVAVMNIQARMENTLPGQGVIVLLMGDSTMASDEQALSTATDLAPMQAFYFSTGIGVSECNEAPNSIIVQSPSKTAVTLTINEAKLTISSTAMLFTVEDQSAFEIIMLEGEGILNDSMRIPQGFWAAVPFDATATSPIEGVGGVASTALPNCRRVPDDRQPILTQQVAQLPASVLHYPVTEIVQLEESCEVIDGTLYDPQNGPTVTPASNNTYN